MLYRTIHPSCTSLVGCRSRSWSGTNSLPLLTLTALEVQTVESASLSIEFSRSKVTPEGSVKDEATLDALKNCINTLVSAARLKKQI